jgi:hypothetical protein
MAEDLELGRLKTVWVRGAANSKMGTAVLSHDRLSFWDTKYLGTGGGAIQAVLVDRLQKRHEEGGPMFDLPLASITAMRRAKKLLNKNRLVIVADGEEYVFNEGWKDFAPQVREALETHHGRRVVEQSEEEWRVEPA